MTYSPHQAAVLKTLLYASLFDYPLTLSEIHARLIFPSAIDKRQTQAAINQLISHQAIAMTQDYYHLFGQAHIARIRKTRHQPSVAKHNQAIDVASKLSRIKPVKAIFLTGAVACHNATDDDDIDLMIICQPNQLWTARLLVLLSLEKMRIRRHPHQQQVKNTICPNLFLTTHTLALPTSHHNLYTAHEIMLAQPIYDPDNLADQFKSANKWMTRFLGNTIISRYNHHKHPLTQPDMVEQLLYHLQRCYMSSKITREIIKPHRAHFHPNDTNNQILTAYQNKLDSYALSYP